MADRSAIEWTMPLLLVVDENVCRASYEEYVLDHEADELEEGDPDSWESFAADWIAAIVRDVTWTPSFMDSHVVTRVDGAA